jgi:hypothetical protein
MNSKSEIVNQHVQACLHHLTDTLGLRDLLALTQPQAAAGQVSLDLVLPIVAERSGPCWPLLHSAFPHAQATLAGFAALSGALAQVDPWTASGIEAAVSMACEAQRMAHDALERLLHLTILQHTSALPLAAVMQVLGKDRCMARLERAAASFQRAQMIG